MTYFYRDPASMVSFLEVWIINEMKKESASGGVIGLSGGIDSAAAAALLRHACGRDNMLALIMPCRNAPEDERDARLIAETLDIPVKKVDITEAYDTLANGIEASCGKLGRAARAEIKPKLRMAALYSVAQVRNFMVVGAGNKDELYLGDFTKYGEVGVDMLPFGDLLAGEVTALARYLNVPDEIINRPRAGAALRDQSDGAEADLTYDDIDLFIATGNTDPGTAMKIKEAYEISRNKRSPVRIPAVPRANFR
ncbi:MAG: NAD(+) synthase [Synergistaceae bacterium]|nr:NAD(+) synthase [Synergistaceae bacterium]